MTSKKPLQASFEITRRCNSRCRICNYWKNPSSPSKELQIEEIRGIFTDLYEFGIRYVFLSGGEPFLREDIVEVAETLKEIGVSVELVTNGILLNETLIRSLLDMPNLRIVVSLDSLRPELYAQIRGVDKLPEVLSNIRILAELSSRRKLPSRINMTINSLNYPEVGNMIQLCNSLGLYFSAYPYNSADRGMLMSDDDILATRNKREDIARAFEFLSDRCIEEKRIFGFSFTYGAIASFVRGEYIGPCGAGRDHIIVDPDGNVSVCEEFSPFGCLRKDRIKEVFSPQAWAEEVEACATHTPCFLGCSRVLTMARKHPFGLLHELLVSGKLLGYLSYLYH